MSVQPDPRIVFPQLPDDVPQLDVANSPVNPLDLMNQWLAFALAYPVLEPSYVTLATASADGVPSSRTVQLLDIQSDELRFTTNFGSRKGVEMRATGRAAFSMYWRETAQSINVTGHVVEATPEQSDAWFALEHRNTQASRTVSFHGKPLLDEAEQLARFRELTQASEPIERPDYWNYFSIVPDSVTFWEGHPDALNRRLHYTRTDGVWTHQQIEA